jgi:hypothetical protein
MGSLQLDMGISAAVARPWWRLRAFQEQSKTLPMRAILLNLFTLIIIGACWTLLLWFVFPFHFANYRLVVTIALHAIPPLLLWIGWLIVRRIRRKRRIQAAQNKEALLLAERQANRQAAKEKHEAAMRERRFACHCKALAVRGMAVEDMETIFPSGNSISTAEMAKTNPDLLNPLQVISQILTLAIHNALGSLYDEVPTARIFPIFLVSPSDSSYREDVLTIQKIAKTLIQERMQQQPAQKNAPTIVVPSVISAPVAATAADSAIAIFEQNPDLPGAIILAFDSPASRQQQSQDSDTDESIELDAVFPNGKPMQGVVALCVTSADLEKMVEKIAHVVPDTEWEANDPLRPFWAKNTPMEGNLALLATLTLEERHELLATANLVALHRGVSAQIESKLRPLERASLCQNMIEKNLIAIGEIDNPFDIGEKSAESVDAAPAPEAEPKPPVIGWLVHNAGMVINPLFSNRIVALGTAMTYFKIDLNPVNEASNITSECGTWGCATPWALLAAAIAHTTDKQQPTLCAMYGDEEHLAINMTVPV